ncbi:MAG: phage major capsid protein [Eubacteriales bacterium]
MGRKQILERKKQRLEAKRAELLARSQTSEDVAELRAINEQLTSIAEDLQDVVDELAMLANDEGDGMRDGDGDKEGEDEERSAAPAPEAVQTRGGNPMASYGQTQPQTQTREAESYLDSMEYRKAFANYVRTGVWNYEAREAAIVTTADIGKIIPNTILQEVIKELKSYGNLFNRVRKLNIPGGVEVPIEDLIPTVSWITETTVSDTQKAPELKTSVSFGYHIAEARIAQTLLSQVVSLAMLESEIAKLLAEAFIKEFDRIILSGSGSGQPLGILNDSRVLEKNKITMAAADAVDWSKWREKLFAKIPLSYRAGGVLVMTVDTWEGLICTMKDSNNRPIYTETYDVNTGAPTYRFNGKEVVLIENDLGIGDYSTAKAGEVYMLYFKPTDYAINSNMQLGFKRYYNEDSNKWVNKGLCIMDGKLLDVNSCYIIKK